MQILFTDWALPTIRYMDQIFVDFFYLFFGGEGGECHRRFI